MATLSNRIFGRLEGILNVPLLALGRIARILPVSVLWMLERTVCRIFGPRIARLFDGSFFNVALLGRPVICQMHGAEVRGTITFKMEYDASEYIQRVAPLFGLLGPSATVPYCLDQRSVLFDVGASLGMITVPAALRMRNPRRVHAFEPNPKARARLMANLNRNGVEACVNDVALSNRASEATLHVELGESGGGSLIAGVDRGRPIHWLERHPPETFPVRTTTFDAYLESIPPSERAAWGNVLVKIDVEGFEASVLEGAQVFLDEEKRPLLLIVETARFNVPRVPNLLFAKGFVLVEEVMPRLFRRLPSVPERRVVDLMFLKNVWERVTGTFEWPFAT